MPTQRDRIWRATVELATEYRKFEVQDVLFELDSEPSRKTVQRTLRAMTELDVLRHRRGSPKYSAGDVLREAGGRGHGEPSRVRRVVLEEDDVDDEPEPTGTVDDVQEESAGADVDDDLRAEVLEELGDAAPKPPHAKDALVTIVELLEERGSLKTSELKEEVYERHGEHYGSKNAMWESLTRFFDESPHIEDGGWGVWASSSPDRD